MGYSFSASSFWGRWFLTICLCGCVSLPAFASLPADSFFSVSADSTLLVSADTSIYETDNLPVLDPAPHSLQISAGAGVAFLPMTAEGLSTSFLPSFSASLTYRYFPFRHVGIVTGVSGHMLNASSIRDYSYELPHVDSDGDNYTRITSFISWEEKISLIQFNVPLCLAVYATVAKRFCIEFDGGVMAGFTLKSNFETLGGSINTKGYYPQYELTLFGIPEHGFYSIDEKISGNAELPGIAIWAGGSIDFLFRLNARLQLALTLYGWRCMNDLAASDGQEQFDTFAPYSDAPKSYNSITKCATDIHPISTGAQLGLRIAFGKRKHKTYQRPVPTQEEKQEEKEEEETTETVDSLLQTLPEVEELEEIHIETKPESIIEKEEEPDSDTATNDNGLPLIIPPVSDVSQTTIAEEPTRGIEEPIVKIEEPKEEPVTEVVAPNEDIVEEHVVKEIEYLREVQQDLLEKSDAIRFDLGKSTPTEESEPAIAAVAKTLIDDPALTIKIEGHTCDIGSESYNLLLGLERAKNIRQNLIERGAKPTQIIETTAGKWHPIEQNTSEEKRKKNRRVEVIVISAHDVSKVVAAEKPIRDAGEPVAEMEESEEEPVSEVSAPKEAVTEEPIIMENEYLREVRRDLLEKSDAIRFDLGKSTPTEESEPAIAAVAKTLVDDPALTIKIEGHTCDIGSESYNLLLGLERAKSIRQNLIERGAKPTQIIETTAGKWHPIEQNTSEELRKKNRRVEVIAIGR